MRKADVTQHCMYSDRTLEERVRADHPLRKLRVLVDGILLGLHEDIGALYSRRGRPSIAPERLLRASLLQVLFSIRSERQLVQHLDYNLLYRWFVGMNMDEQAWNHSTFSANRERLFSEAMAQKFFARVLRIAEWQKLVSDEHFTVDGTLIEAWASMKSFVKKDGGGKPPEDGGRNPTVDFKGEQRSNDTHQSTTDGDARLYKKGDGDKSRLCYMGHALMENRNGLVVDVQTTRASGTAEREAALAMARRTIKAGATLGGDKGYDAAGFIKDLRAEKITAPMATCSVFWRRLTVL
jgi:transposase